MSKMTLFTLATLVFLGATAISSTKTDNTAGKKFSDIISVIGEKREELTKHKFIDMLRDPEIPYKKRMSFAPHLCYFTMSFADLLDSWLYEENLESEIQKMVNIHVGEDNFHFNFYLHDVEEVLGYKFDSYSAVVRQIWSKESKSSRLFMYYWAACVEKYDDPLITLVTIEAVEACGKDFFQTVFDYIYSPDDGLKGLEYFGPTHLELEQNHTQTNWFKEDGTESPQLEALNVTPVQWAQAKEVVDGIFTRFHSVLDDFYKIVRDSEEVSSDEHQFDDLTMTTADQEKFNKHEERDGHVPSEL